MVEWSGGATGLDQWLPVYLPFRALWQMAIRSCPRFLHPLCSFRTAGFPQYGWKPASSLCTLLKPGTASFDAGPVPIRNRDFWLSVQASPTTAVPTGPWLSTVYHVRACHRYYGLIHQSDELRPAWASSAYSGRSLPWRAVRLTFPSWLGQSAIATRPNHPLPRQDFHLQVCSSPKAAHRKLVLGAPACNRRCAGEPRRGFVRPL